MNQTSVVGVRVRNMDKEAMKKNAREEGFLNLNGTANLSFFLRYCWTEYLMRKKKRK